MFKNTALDTGNTENPCVCNTNTGSAKIIDRKNTEESNAKIIEGGPHQKMNCPGAVTCSGSELQTVSCNIRVSKRYKTLIDTLLTEGFFSQRIQ